MYRSRSKGALDKETLKFLSSEANDHCILYYDILGSEAHSIMLYEIGILTSSELKKILQALEEVKMNPEKLSIEGFEDIHESVEAYVIERAGINVGGKMHTARSRNDQVILDIHMKVRDDVNDICIGIIDLIDTLLKKAEDNKEAVMPMYTHLQQAQIGTFSHFLLSYADALFRDMDRLYIAYGRINLSPLGSSAIAGSGINVDRKKTAIMLAFDGLIKNSVDATSSRDTIIEFTSGLAIMMITLSRMAEDFIIWSTSEFGYLDISDEYTSTSSAMPQKKNPDPLELLRAKAASVLGSLVSMITLVKAIPSGYSRDLQDLKPSLWKVSSTALQSLKIMDNVIKSLDVHKDIMHQAASNSYAIALDIAEQLVMRKGMPFRAAHQLVGSLVQKAINDNDLPLRMLQKQDIQAVLEKIESNLQAEEVLEMIKEMTPERSVTLRISTGSPNPEQQQEMIRFSTRRLTGYKEGVPKRKNLVEKALNNLTKLVEAYLKAE